MKAAQISSHDRFVLLSLDRLEYYQELLGAQPQTPEGCSVLEKFITLAVKTLSPDTTGIILEPEFGFASLVKKATKTGVLFSLEKRQSSAPLQLPVLNENWGVEACRENFGLAKLELFYHPQEEQALAKKQLIAEIHDYCKYVGIDLLIVARMHHPQGGVLAASVLVDAQLETVHELQKNCEIMGLEYPGSALAAATITAEIDIPWLLVSQTQVKLEPYAEYKLHAREVLENGASGCILGEVVFSDLNDHLHEDATLDWDHLERYLTTQVRDHVVEIKRIVQEAKLVEA